MTAVTTYAIAMDSVKNGNMTFSPKNAVKGTIVIKRFIPEPIGKDIYITDIFLDRCYGFFLLNQVSAEFFYKSFVIFFIV